MYEIEFDDTICSFCEKPLPPYELIIPGSVEDLGFCSVGCMVKQNMRTERIKKEMRSRFLTI